MTLQWFAIPTLALLTACPGTSGPARVLDWSAGTEASITDGGQDAPRADLELTPGADGAISADGPISPDGSISPDGPISPDAWTAEAGPAPVCAAGAIKTEACGACDTGTRSRSCNAKGQWSAWGPCTGAQAGFPIHPSTQTPVCPPYVWPAVFFSPHPDDESISMAGAIAEHVAAGRQVFVELLTRGQASGAINTLSNGGTCPWHSGSHVYSLTPTAFGDARVKEFMQATAALKVAGVYLSDFGDGNLTVSEVGQRIAFWQAHQDPAKPVSYKGSIGTTQAGAGGANHPDHIAVWTALTTSGLSDVRGYTSSFYTPVSGKPVVTKSVAPSLCSAKVAALGAYKLWSPGGGRYAVGYHSVKSMIDAVSSSCQEYVIFFTP